MGEELVARSFVTGTPYAPRHTDFADKPFLAVASKRDVAVFRLDGAHPQVVPRMDLWLPHFIHDACAVSRLVCSPRTILLTIAIASVWVRTRP